MRRGLIAVAVASIGLLLSDEAMAQTEAEFVKAFAGAWQIVDSRYTVGVEPCRISLSNEQAQGRYQAEASSCAAEAARVKSWGLINGQMSLFDSSGIAIASLGGNQKRMSGNTPSGTPVILERIGISGTAEVLEVARKEAGCFYAGFTDRCAPDAELQKPMGEAPQVNVLVNLNARSEAREDASVIDVVPASTCIQTELCLTATDGAWCRATFNNKLVWLRKLALRKNRWPVVTFFNSCPTQ